MKWPNAINLINIVIESNKHQGSENILVSVGSSPTTPGCYEVRVNLGNDSTPPYSEQTSWQPAKVPLFLGAHLVLAFLL